MYKLELSEEQREILTMALEQWLFPFEETANQAIQDRSHRTVEEMLESINCIHHMFDIGTDLMTMLEDVYARSTVQLLRRSVLGDGESSN